MFHIIRICHIVLIWHFLHITQIMHICHIWYICTISCIYCIQYILCMSCILVIACYKYAQNYKHLPPHSWISLQRNASIYVLLQTKPGRSSSDTVSHWSDEEIIADYGLDSWKGLVNRDGEALTKMRRVSIKHNVVISKYDSNYSNSSNKNQLLGRHVHIILYMLCIFSV
jgi:hypothetical protein